MPVSYTGFGAIELAWFGSYRTVENIYYRRHTNCFFFQQRCTEKDSPKRRSRRFICRKEQGRRSPGV